MLRIRVLPVLAITLLMAVTAVIRYRPHPPMEPVTPASEAVPVPAPVADPKNPAFMPLTAGRTLTYRETDGREFTLAFGSARSYEWFDGSLRSLVPVADSRCRCAILMEREGPQVRAVGTIEQNQIFAWGEFLLLFPGAEYGQPDPITTPAGHFGEALRVESGLGPTWFAPGVGLIKTQLFELIQTEEIERLVRR